MKKLKCPFTNFNDFSSKVRPFNHENLNCNVRRLSNKNVSVLKPNFAPSYRYIWIARVFNLPAAPCKTAYRVFKYTKQNAELQDDIMKQTHTQPGILQHEGVERTYLKLRQNYFWPRMRATITAKIAQCQVCAIVKPRRVITGVKPLPCPGQPFEMICLDYFGGQALQRYQHKTCVLTVVDRLSGFTQYFAMATRAADEVIQVLENRWINVVFESREG